MKFNIACLIFTLTLSCKPANPSHSESHETNFSQLPGWYADERIVPSFEFHYHDALSNLPQGEESIKRLCFQFNPTEPDRWDRLRRAFCSENPPAINSLFDLQKALGLNIPADLPAGRENNGVPGKSPGFVLTGHSTSLVSRYVSPINPRAIIFSAPKDNKTPDNDFIVMGFVRGDQFVEVAAKEPQSGKLNFYLISFRQACNTNGGCSNGHLQSSAIEENWLAVDVYEDQYLTNTVFDCTHCHQPEGPQSEKILRMQEVEEPWTHFFRDDTAGKELIQEFKDFHGDNESIAGIPASLISSSDPEKLSWLLQANGFGEQPNHFASRLIEEEIGTSDEPGASWLKGWQAYLKGEVIPFPSWKNNILNKDVVSKLKSEWQEWRKGERSIDSLPDLRMAIDDRLGPSMGTRAAKSISARELLHAACTRCHNNKLDRTLGKSLFRTEFDEMYADQIQVAIDRVELLKTDPSSPLAMPPRMFMDLTESEIDMLIDQLKKIKNGELD